MQSLVIGASGLVGSALYARARQQGQAFGTYRNFPCAGLEQLELRDFEKLQTLIKERRPDVIYLPASLTNVDFCEDHPEESFESNVRSVLHVLEAVAGTETRVVYFSSDYVFDGKDGPYRETDPISPINVYGRHKCEAETAVLSAGKRHLVIRTTGVFGDEPQGKNFVVRVVSTLKAGKELVVPSDQVATPTWSENLAELSCALVAGGAAGIFNIVGPDRLSRFAFAQSIAKVFDLDTAAIKGVPTSALGQKAARPLSGGLRLEKLKNWPGIPEVLGVEEALLRCTHSIKV